MANSGLATDQPKFWLSWPQCSWPTNNWHSLQFALNRALLKIFGALSKDTYQDICKYFGIWIVKKQISVHKSTFNFKISRIGKRCMSYNLQIDVVVKYDTLKDSFVMFIANAVTCFYFMVYMLSIFIHS